MFGLNFALCKLSFNFNFGCCFSLHPRMAHYLLQSKPLFNVHQKHSCNKIFEFVGKKAIWKLWRLVLPKSLIIRAFRVKVLVIRLWVIGISPSKWLLTRIHNKVHHTEWKNVSYSTIIWLLKDDFRSFKCWCSYICCEQSCLFGPVEWHCESKVNYFKVEILV